MAAVEQMQWGSIINISSLSPFGPVPNSGHYAACKPAVNSLTQTMTHELAPDIRVNGVAPGPVATPQFFGNLDARNLDQLTARLPLGLGTPQDVGDTVVFLASDAARWITGQTLVISGCLPIF